MIVQAARIPRRAGGHSRASIKLSITSQLFKKAKNSNIAPRNLESILPENTEDSNIAQFNAVRVNRAPNTSASRDSPLIRAVPHKLMGIE